MPFVAYLFHILTSGHYIPTPPVVSWSLIIPLVPLVYVGLYQV